MASSSTQMSSSIPSSAPTVWDVFLSFRGEDTRLNFTSHLYTALCRSGIRTFMDDPELRSGQVISTGLLHAIQNSKTYIVVFSQNYASSSWCLDELVEILKCCRSTERLVHPVFYNIDPSVVRHQTGSYKVAFEKHQDHLAGDRDKLNRWRLTLTQVAEFSGYHVSGTRSETDIINEVVGRVLVKVNPATLHVAKYPVGIDSRIIDITQLLSSSSEGVTRIGIYGMGGVGKTTLAKGLYNQEYRHFHGSCFLANVREVSGQPNGRVSLQEQLIADILKVKEFPIHSIDQGIELIRERICSKRVLIVVDDLDHQNQLDYLVGPFASGSVIIVTTRDENLLNTIEVESKYRYKVKELNNAESLELFHRHAFRNIKPSNTLMVLSEDVLRHAGGLPLALEVFGSSLLNQTEKGWRYFIEKLQRFPNSDIQEKLMISFKALDLEDPTLKNIFIDIACFFIRMKKNFVVERMETSYWFVDHKIDILKKRCLITISNENVLGMHDLLGDMGREIARNKSLDEPGKHSRLWQLQDICDVLMKTTGTEAVEVIMFPFFQIYPSEGFSFAAETFKRMSNLRFLCLSFERYGKVNLTGSFEQTFEKLQWLCWSNCSLVCLPSDFSPQKIVMLELRHSKLITMWERTKVLAKLKVLDVSYSCELVTTPDFSGVLCLEKLILVGCERLEEVHWSIGCLARLVSLNLEDCWVLRSLPDSICKLRALKTLNIDRCFQLQALPAQLGNVESLTRLTAWGLNISKLPDSIGCLSKLLELILDSNEYLETLPDTICNLISLEMLDISRCKTLEELPFGIRQLPNLKLPHNLKQLNAAGCTSMERLPNISTLQKLEILNLSNCSSLSEIIGLEKVISIRRLHLEGCNSSVLANTLTESMFQVYSGSGNQIKVYVSTPDIPIWISHWSSVSTMCVDVVSHNFLGMLLCFTCSTWDDYSYHQCSYSIKCRTSGLTYSDDAWFDTVNTMMVIVPKNKLSVNDGEDKIDVTASCEPSTTVNIGVHPLYKPVVPLPLFQDDEDEENRSSHPSKRLKHDLEQLK